MFLYLLPLEYFYASIVSVLWCCWLGDRKGYPLCIKLNVGLLVVTIWLEIRTSYSSSCQHHFHHPYLQ